MRKRGEGGGGWHLWHRWGGEYSGLKDKGTHSAVEAVITASRCLRKGQMRSRLLSSSGPGRPRIPPQPRSTQPDHSSQVISLFIHRQMADVNPSSGWSEPWSGTEQCLQTRATATASGHTYHHPYVIACRHIDVFHLVLASMQTDDVIPYRFQLFVRTMAN